MSYTAIPDLVYRGAPVYAWVTDAPPAPVLKPSGPIKIIAGQVVENLLITADGSVDGISGAGTNDAIIRNVKIVLLGSASKNAITLTDSARLKIDKVVIEKQDAPLAGPLASEQNGIFLARCDDARMTNIRTRHVTKAINPYQCARFYAGMLQLLNPRTGGGIYGMGFQTNACTVGTFENFSVLVDLAHDATGDTCNIFNSDQITIRNGLIDGNTFAAGVNLMIQNDAAHPATGHFITDVDALHGCNGSFSAYPSVATFTRARVRDMLALTPAGLKPASGGLAFTASPGSKTGFLACQYWNLANPAGVDWNETYMTAKEFLHADFVPRAPIVLTGMPGDP